MKEEATRINLYFSPQQPTLVNPMLCVRGVVGAGPNLLIILLTTMNQQKQQQGNCHWQHDSEIDDTN